MKKIMFSLLFAGIAVSASAQKNSVLVFGDLGGSAASTSVSGAGSSTSTSSFHIRPGVGYQVNDNWTFGVELAFNHGNVNVMPPAPTATTNNEFGGGLFARRTWAIGSMFYFFTQADVLYTAGSLSSGGSTVPNSDYSNLGVGITPAFGINIKNGWALNFEFGRLAFNYWSSSSTPKVSTTSFDYNFFSGTGFGISKNFAKKMKPAKKHSDAEANESGE